MRDSGFERDCSSAIKSFRYRTIRVYRMKNYRRLLWGLVLLGACRTEVPIDDVEHRVLPVVNAMLIAGDTLEIQVSKSSAVNGLEIDHGDIAHIDVVCAHDRQIEFEYSHHGIYKSAHIVEAGASYHFTIAVDGFDTITHTISMPPVPNLLDIECVADHWASMEQETHPTLFATFEADCETERYFEARLKVYDYDYVDTLGTRVYTYTFKKYVDFVNQSDPILKDEGLPITLFSNENIDTDRYTMELNFYNYEQYAPYQLEFRSVTEDYYHYVQSLYVYDLGRYPDTFMATPSYSQIYSNIVGGYGIIAGYSSTLSEKVNFRDE